MKKAFLSGLAAGALSVIGGVAFKLHHFHKRPGKMVDHVVNHLDRKLHLTTAQKEHIRDAVTVLFREHKALKEQKQELHSTFSELFLSDSFESDSMMESVEQKLVAPALVQVGKALEEVHRTLSPEQRREFIRLMEKHHGCCCHHC